MNRRAAEAKLAKLIADAIAPPSAERKPTHPSPRTVQARLDAKRHRSEIERRRRSVED
jgi:ribosome-associated protein